MSKILLLNMQYFQVLQLVSLLSQWLLIMVILLLLLIISLGFGFFIGSFFVQHDIYNPVSHRGYTVGDVLAVFFSIIFASFALGTL